MRGGLRSPSGLCSSQGVTHRLILLRCNQDLQSPSTPNHGRRSTVPQRRTCLARRASGAAVFILYFFPRLLNGRVGSGSLAASAKVGVRGNSRKREREGRDGRFRGGSGAEKRPEMATAPVPRNTGPKWEKGIGCGLV